MSFVFPTFRVNWCQSNGYFSTIAGDDDELKGLFPRIDTLQGGVTLSQGCLLRLMIEVWPMVCTEADIIIKRINHHHINHHYIFHHQGIIYNIPNLLNFSMKRSYEVPSIAIMILEKIVKMEGCTMKGNRGSLILTLIGKEDF